MIRIVEQHKGSFVYDIYVDKEYRCSVVGLHQAFHEAERIMKQLNRQMSVVVGGN